jgi:hypothetical protein
MKSINSLIGNNSNKPLDLSGCQNNLDNNNPHPNISKISETISKNSETPTNNRNLQKNTDSSPQDKSIEWTYGKLKDELYIHLISIKINGKRKYEEQAKYLIHRISVFRPTPYFIINQSDLSSRLVKELEELDNINLDAVIKEVLSWIYEIIDKHYFLLSIKRYGLIFWRIEP